MTWHTEPHDNIEYARLKASSPEVVYEQLKLYAAFGLDNYFWSGDDVLESTLLERNDPLINLGLARYGAANKTISELYARGLALSASDPVQGNALVLSCLSNQVVAKVLFSTNGFARKAILGADELRRLATESQGTELAVLLANPNVGDVVSAVFNKESPFDGIDDARYRTVVRMASVNERINQDNSSEHGPDGQILDIHKGIYSLLKTAPVDSEWATTLYALLDKLDPSITKSGEGDIEDILNRWKPLIINYSNGESTEAEGWTTTLRLVDEFRCMIAALYGRRIEEKNVKSIGSLDDPDVVKRCAIYGRAQLTPDDMQLAFNKDNAVFVFAALLNNNLFYDKKCRAQLENMITGNERFRYARRCEQIQKHSKEFDPRPVSERGKSLLEDVIDQKVSPESTTMARLEMQMKDLQKQLTNAKSILWVITALVFISIFWKH